MKATSFVRRRHGFAVLGFLVLLVVLGGGAANAPAASPQISVTKTVLPGQGASVAYSETLPGQSTYVSYTISVARSLTDNNRLTHARVSDPVTCGTTGCNDAEFAGAEIVSVSDSCGTAVYRGTAAFPKQGVTCELGSLPAGTAFDIQIVVKVPTKANAAGASSLSNLAALFVDETGSDEQPQASHQDTFPSNSSVPVVTPLTDDATDVINSFAPAAATTTFQTDPNQSATNFQATLLTLTGPPSGTTVGLQECDGLGADCPSGTPTPCPAGCSTQTSLIFVSGSGGDFFQAHHLTMQLTFFPNELSKTFNWKKLIIYHDLNPVGLCTGGTPDPTGDCVKTITLDKATGRVVVTIDGPSQGGWGGAG